MNKLYSIATYLTSLLAVVIGILIFVKGVELPPAMVGALVALLGIYMLCFHLLETDNKSLREKYDD